MPEIKLNKKIDCDDIEITEWSSEFERLMRNRLIMGAFRYGKMRDNKKQYERVEGLEQRIKLYKETSNKEYLVDIANLAMLEFEENKDAKFETIDDGVHVKKVLKFE